MTSNRWPWAAVLVVVVVVLYLPTLRSGTVFDDGVFVFENPLIQAPDGLAKFWFSTEPPDYFPLTSSVLWVEWRLWGERPLGYHALNVLLHALGCVLLWRALLRLAVPGAFAAALLFAVHPVNVETVAWITQLKNTLPFVLVLLAFLAWLRSEDLEDDPRRQRRAYAASLFAFLLALLAKTSVVFLPPALLLCAWWRRGRVTARDVRRTAPFFALAAALGLATVWYQTYSNIGAEVVRSDDFLSRLALAGRALWFYLGKACVPVGLSAVYPRWEADTSRLVTWLPLAALVASFAALLAARRRPWARAALFALAFDVLALLPVLGFVDVYFMRYSLVADHWQHVALVAPVALAAAALTRGGARLGLPAPWILALPAVALLAVLSWQQQAAWRDDEALWSDVLAHDPSSHFAEYGVGRALDGRGDLAGALPHYERAILLEPDDADAQFNLAHALVRLGRPAEAVPHYRAVLALQPQHLDARLNLGAALHALGRFDEAVACYEEALLLAPDDAALRLNLGLALQKLGRWDEALAQHEQALRLAPTLLPAQHQLANDLAALGREREAIAQYDALLRGAPDHVPTLARLAWILATTSDATLRDAPRAVTLAERAHGLAGDDAALLDTLATACAAAGRFADAVRWEERALQLAGSAPQDPLQQRLEMFRRGEAWRGPR